MRSDAESNVPLNPLPGTEAPFGREALERNAPVDGVSNYSANDTQISAPITTPAIDQTLPAGSQGSNVGVSRGQHLRFEAGGPLSSNPTHPMSPGILAAIERSKRHVKRPNESMAEFEARLHRTIPNHSISREDEPSQVPANLEGNLSINGDANHVGRYSERHGEHRNRRLGQSSNQVYTSQSPGSESPLLSPTVDGIIDNVSHLNLAAVSNGDHLTAGHSYSVPGASVENYSSSNLSYSVGDEVGKFSIRRLNESSSDTQIVHGSSMELTVEPQSNGDIIVHSLHSAAQVSEQTITSEQYNFDLNANQQAYPEEEFSVEDYERDDCVDDSPPEDHRESLTSAAPASSPIDVFDAAYAADEEEIDAFEAIVNETIDFNNNNAPGGSLARVAEDAQDFVSSSINSMNSGESSRHPMSLTTRSVDGLQRASTEVTMISLAEARACINNWLATNYPSAPADIQELHLSKDPKDRLKTLMVYQGVLRYGFDEYRETSRGEIHEQQPECKELIDYIRHLTFVVVRKTENGSTKSTIYDDPLWTSIESKLIEVHEKWGKSWEDEAPKLLIELLRDGY